MHIETPKTFKSTRMIFAVAMVVFVLSVGIYGYFFYALKSTSRTAANLETEVKSLQAQESEIGVLRKNLAATEESRAKLVSYFIQTNDIVPFLETVESYGRGVNVSTEFEDVKVVDKPTSIVLTVVGKGSFANIYRFVSLVEAIPYEISVQSASVQSLIPAGLSPDGPGTHGDQWEVRLSLTVTSVTASKNTN